MTYEIKLRFTRKGNEDKVIEEIRIATEVETTTRNGLDAIKVMPEGKTRWAWYEVPNDYQMQNYFGTWELTISEATTGKNVYKVVR